MTAASKKFLLFSLTLALVLACSACATDATEAPTGEQPVIVVEETIPAEVTESGGVESTGEATPEATPDPAAESGLSVGMIGAGEGYMMLASAILGRDVANRDGEELGDVEDFLVDLTSGNVLFALITHGGFLGIGSEEVPIPLSALSLESDQDDLMLNVTEEQFETFPDVSVSDDWPLGLDETWDDAIGTFWTSVGFDVSNMEGVEPEIVVRASQMLGYGFGTATASGLGNTVDYIVDLGESRVEYAVLSVADTGAGGDDWVVVPFQAFEPTLQTTNFGDELLVDEGIDDDLLIGAPRIRSVDMTDVEFFAPGWDEAISTYWAEQGYGRD